MIDVLKGLAALVLVVSVVVAAVVSIGTANDEGRKQNTETFDIDLPGISADCVNGWYMIKRADGWLYPRDKDFNPIPCEKVKNNAD